MRLLLNLSYKEYVFITVKFNNNYYYITFDNIYKSPSSDIVEGYKLIALTDRIVSDTKKRLILMADVNFPYWLGYIS